MKNIIEKPEELKKKQETKHPYHYKVKEAIKRLKRDNEIITKTKIAEEAGLPNREPLRTYPDLRKLVEEAIDNLIKQKTKKLFKTYKRLRGNKQHITLEILYTEARIGEKTLRKYGELHELAKNLVEEALKQEEQEWLEKYKGKLRQAYKTLADQNKNITIKALAKEVGIHYSKFIPSNRRYNKLNEFAKALISGGTDI